VVRAIYERVAARAGVNALRVNARKPDVYPDARAVGVALSSF
jgi:dihydroneopterin aldolase